MAAHVGPQVDALMADPLRSHYVSELGVLEFRNTLAKLCRSTTPESAALGTDWMSAAVTELMGRIARSEISVVRTEPRMYLHATSLVDLAARAGIAFGTWDTVHVLDAALLSRELGQPVELVTADKAFTKFTTHFVHFARFVQVVTLEDAGGASRV